MGKRYMCTKCGVPSVKKTFLGGNKIGNVIIIIPGVLSLYYLASLSEQIEASGESIPLHLAFAMFSCMIWTGLAIWGLFLPKYKCTKCGEKFSVPRIQSGGFSEWYKSHIGKYPLPIQIVPVKGE
jgi:hypothetical protein